LGAFFIWFSCYLPNSPGATGLASTRVYLEVFIIMLGMGLLACRLRGFSFRANSWLFLPVAYLLFTLLFADSPFAYSDKLRSLSLWVMLAVSALVLDKRSITATAHCVPLLIIGVSLAVILQHALPIGRFSLIVAGLPVIEVGQINHWAGFGQRNVMASFVACLVVFLLYRSGEANPMGSDRWELAAIVAGSSLVSFSGSKIGLLGLIFCSFIILLLIARQRCRLSVNQILIDSSPILVGLLLGWALAQASGSVSGFDRLVTETGIGQTGLVLGSTYLSRLDAWYAAFSAWIASPWLGSGPGSFLHHYQDLALGEKLPFNSVDKVFTLFHSHNMPLQVLVEEGLVGLAWTAAPFAIWAGLKIRSRSRLMIGLVIAGPILLHSLVEFPLIISALPLILLVFIPLVLADDQEISPFIAGALQRGVVMSLCVLVSALHASTLIAALVLNNYIAPSNNRLMTDWMAGDRPAENLMDHAIIGPYAKVHLYQQASIALKAADDQDTLASLVDFSNASFEWFPSRNAYELLLMTHSDRDSGHYDSTLARYEQLKALLKP